MSEIDLNSYYYLQVYSVTTVEYILNDFCPTFFFIFSITYGKL